MWYQNIRSALFSFVTIHASDGQTDGRTEFRQQYRALHYMQSHGKNAYRAWQTVFDCYLALDLPVHVETFVYRSSTALNVLLTAKLKAMDNYLTCDAVRTVRDKVAETLGVNWMLLLHNLLTSLRDKNLIGKLVLKVAQKLLIQQLFDNFDKFRQSRTVWSDNTTIDNNADTH